MTLSGRSTPKSVLSGRSIERVRGQRRALVIDDPNGGSSVAPERCFRGVEIAGHIAVPANQASFASAVALYRPQLLLVKAPLADVGFELLRTCSERGIKVLVLLRPSYGTAFSGRIVRLGGLPWLSLPRLRLAWRYRFAKRALDLGLLLCSAPVVLPAMAIIALAVALSSPGGFIYGQTRLGKGGKLFVLLKFRSMHVHAERESGPILTSSADPRVTRVGAVLRRLRLDELPQLWNVVRGDMSLVGPRPERPELMADFMAIEGHESRHFMRPGLTGLAQLVGGYPATAAEKLRCDLIYLSSRSLTLDARLIALTLLDMARGFPHA